jgi:hypothetical protein
MIVVAALAVVAVAIACLEGWGRLVVAGVVRLTGKESQWDLPGVRGAIGIAVLASFTGLLVLARLPAEVPFWILAAAGLAGWLVRPPTAALRREERGWLALRLGILAVLAAWLVIWALAQPTFQQCDDNIAYIPFAHEILHIGGLDEPFSQRRIGTLGPSIPIEFWGYQTLGPLGALLGDVIICPILTAAALLWSNRRWPGITIGGAGAIVAGLAPIGRTNFGPSGITVLMLVALGLIAVRTIPGGGRARLAGVIVAAALASQLIGFRLHYALVALAPVALMVLWTPQRLRTSIVAAAALIVPILGWSLASWRDTGTPLFPVLGKGTLNPDWPGYKDPAVHGLHALTTRSTDLLRFDHVGLMIVALITVSAVLLVARRPAGRPFAVPLAMAVATLGTIAALPVLLTTAPLFDAWRITRPLVVGTLLVLLALLSGIQPLRVRWLSRLVLPLVVAIALAQWVGQTSWSNQWTRVKTFGDGLDLASDFSTDPYVSARYKYSVLKRFVPSNAVVAYAVDEPALLQGVGHRSYNLDILGANSPPPGLPFFRGPKAKVNYFRARGIDYLVTVEPAKSACLYSTKEWRLNEMGGPRIYRVYQLWAPYFLDWLKDIQRIVREEPTERFDDLRLTRLAGS